MGEILSGINASGRKNKIDFEDHFIKKIVQKLEESENDLLLKMSGGNVNEYKELKNSSISDFLIKFNYFCKEIERKSKRE